MKFIIVLALAMLISFSMETKLRSKSKSKQLDSQYLNTLVRIESSHRGYLSSNGNYRVSICRQEESFDCHSNREKWTIKPVENGYYNVILSKGDCLCIRGNDPSLCNIEDPDSQMKLIPGKNGRIGFQGKSGKYLRAGLLNILNTASKMDSWEMWALLKVNP